jgi:hypothetical protein
MKYGILQARMLQIHSTNNLTAARTTGGGFFIGVLARYAIKKWQK